MVEIIDIIVGGHSHSFLYSGTPSIGPDTPVSDYPTIEEQENVRKVLIVQASAYNKYLGNITLYFDEDDSFCYQRECGMGNLITDSMAYAFLDQAKEGEWTGASIAFQVPGGVRAGLESGNVIYADLITTTHLKTN
ncbi:hypothetical protein PVAND_000347 [Polypedilum vanderplanki]|uniref:5'-Nucleotidase C-terminal domain-containing protein n=1 Tax=Polypedilum vanderplanki TaxID=319348 RepID=A0A9J6BJT6_POLVA|nr:hypothetical protein PVAND_000347 [Polypedilum vanderplanki]